MLLIKLTSGEEVYFDNNESYSIEEFNDMLNSMNENDYIIVQNDRKAHVKDIHYVTIG